MTRKNKETVITVTGLPDNEAEATLRQALARGTYSILKKSGRIHISIDSEKSGKESKKYNTVKYIKKISEENNVPLTIVKRTIPAEEKYVRRTTEEFAAGAAPVRGSGSHRLKAFSLKTLPELHEAAQTAAEKSGVSFALWARAAFRKALRDGMDVEFELETPVEVGIRKSSKAKNEPK